MATPRSCRSPAADDRIAPFQARERDGPALTCGRGDRGPLIGWPSGSSASTSASPEALLRRGGCLANRGVELGDLAPPAGELELAGRRRGCGHAGCWDLT